MPWIFPADTPTGNLQPVTTGEERGLRGCGTSKALHRQLRSISWPALQSLVLKGLVKGDTAVAYSVLVTTYTLGRPTRAESTGVALRPEIMEALLGRLPLHSKGLAIGLDQ